MSLNTSLKGRLRNTILPKSRELFPLFEAVVNSIRAIDERNKINPDFEISLDNSKNYESLQTLYSEYKIEQVINELQTCWSCLNNEIVKWMNSFFEKSPEILKQILEN